MYLDHMDRVHDLPLFWLKVAALLAALAVCPRAKGVELAGAGDAFLALLTLMTREAWAGVRLSQGTTAAAADGGVSLPSR